MKARYRIPLLTTVCLLPLAAMAQNVPGIQTAAAAANNPALSASAQASAQITGGGSGNGPSIAGGQGNGPAKPPAGWPPQTVVIKPPPVNLDSKAKAAVGMSTAWRNKSDRPMRDPDGVLRWMFGRSQPRVVCAPANICDVELQANEVINSVQIGDPSFWHMKLALSGSSTGRITHMIFTPYEAGHKTSVLVFTDQRTYAIELVSAERDYVVRTGFTYPDDNSATGDNTQMVLANYHAAVGNGTGSGPSTTNVSQCGDFLKIEGDTPAWRPTVACTDGRKTYIVFPREMQYGEAPVLLGVNADGGWFSAPSEKRVIYRWVGNRIIADTVMDKVELVLGVGKAQQKVLITRQKS